MAFARTTYEVVLLLPPAEEIIESHDAPDTPHIGLAYLGGYLDGYKKGREDGKRYMLGE